MGPSEYRPLLDGKEGVDGSPLEAIFDGLRVGRKPSAAETFLADAEYLAFAGDPGSGDAIPTHPRERVGQVGPGRLRPRRLPRFSGYE